MGCKDKKKILINKVFHSVGPVMPERGACHARLRPGISSSKMPVFKDDRAKIPFSSSKMPQNKDECLVYNCSVAVLRPRAFTVMVT